MPLRVVWSISRKWAMLPIYPFPINWVLQKEICIIFMKSTMITITDWKYTQTLFIMKLDFLNKNHTKDTIKHMSHEIKRFFLPQINYYHYFWAADQPRALNYKYNFLYITSFIVCILYPATISFRNIQF